MTSSEITRHLHIKLKSFSNIAQPLHKEAVRDCSFLYIIAKKLVIISEALLVDVSIGYLPSLPKQYHIGIAVILMLSYCYNIDVAVVAAAASAAANDDDDDD